MSIKENSQAREAVLDEIESQLLGPKKEANDWFDDVRYPPNKHYIMGVLYPQRVDEDMGDETLESTSSSLKTDGDSDEYASAIQSAYSSKPSAMGLSFFIEGENPSIEVGVDCAIYEGNPDETVGSERSPWKRRWLTRTEDDLFQIDASEKDVKLSPAELAGKATLHCACRKHLNGWIVTLALVNRMEELWVKSKSVDGYFFECPSRMLFQVGLKCRPIKGKFASYPNVVAESWDDEEEELGLQYRNKRTWAVGHGVATRTDGPEPHFISTTFFPRTVVPGITFETKQAKKDALSWQKLASCESRFETADLLEEFIDDYGAWVTSQKEITFDDSADQAIVNRITSRQTDAILRMKKGAELIRDSPEVHRSFKLANEAILMQRIRGLDEYAGTIKTSGEASHRVPDYFDPQELAKTGATGWRPFQLAFILLVMPSLVDPDSDDRSLVDLLWFPTGGGKTEAYLGLAAFEIFRRRIMDGAQGCGTAVIKRYTYRVLTFQQFERASTLIACCEYLRHREGDLEDEPITIGLWVGGKITPNAFSSTSNSFEDRSAVGLSKFLLRGVNPYQILRCPWCGTKLVEADGKTHGFDVGEHHFSAHCTDPKCFCSKPNAIPAQIVDEGLYESPPSMLIGTIDKFTQLAWNEASGRLLGASGFDSPSLFIQDELHLINGPLGTLAGLYECAIEQICVHKSQHSSPPKIIGATATIRRSSDQCKALYGKNSAIFPPPGVSADDSYFMRIDPEKAGRMYVGIMGQGHTPLTSLVHVSAAAAMAPLLDTLDNYPDTRDGYWTQVVYLNSRRELSQSMTAAVDDIPKRMRVISKRDGMSERRFQKSKIREISGNTLSEEIPELLAQLDSTLNDEEPPIDFLGSTSILSVGVDKPRLGLMIMNGQPKTTSEYIQASSRVGRGSTPGIVLSHYSAAKPRDRSHYESFQAFHESIYRYVEPVSVTPWALPARERALPAAIVAAVRHSLQNMANDVKAKSVIRNMSEEVHGITKAILDRCEFADPSESEDLSNQIESILDKWLEYAMSNDKLTYANRALDFAGYHLLRPQNSNRRFGEYAAPDSMRHVDRECRLRP